MKSISFSSISKRLISVLMVFLFAFILIEEVFSVTAYATQLTDNVEQLSYRDKLYYGYNVTSGKDLAEPDALQITAPIIDPNSDYRKHIVRNDGAKQLSASYIENSLSELTSEFAKDVSANVFGRIYTIDADVSSAFDLSRRVRNVHSEQYELYSTVIERYHYVVQLGVTEIREYLSEQFKKDLAAVKTRDDAAILFEKYGTHLITGYTFGGRLNITNYKTTSESSQDFSHSMALSEKVSAVVSKVQAGESASITEQYSSLENDATSTSTYKFVSYGGVATSGLTLDGLFTYNQSITDGDKSGFMYTRWINSINNEQNLAIVGIPSSAKSIPLWELLDNSTQSDEIRDLLLRTYISLCGDKYDMYLAQYPVAVINDSLSDRSAMYPDILGAYIETPNHYFYYVTRDDFDGETAHNCIYDKDYVYLNLSFYPEKGEASYIVQNGEQIDMKSAIFKVNKTSGDYFEIKLSYEGEANGSKSVSLLKIPIKSTVFEGGTGTENYPYIITNPNQFMKISENPNANYILEQDIDFSEFDTNEILAINEFRGTLDGNYCKVSNFTIKKADEEDDKWGLFSVNSGTIKNLAIENAGTSVSKEKFGEESIQAKSAGVICGENKGEIENCCLKDVYVNNIIDNSDSYRDGEKIIIATGALAGNNNKTITGCMVSNSCVRAEYLHNKENDYDIFIYSGGLIGELKENGKIISCVVDSGLSGSVFSKSANMFKALSKKENRVFSTMFVGYCNCVATVNNSYVYVRGSSSSSQKAVDIDLEFDKKMLVLKMKPAHYNALRGAYMVCGNDCNIVGSENAGCSEDSEIPIYAITPIKDGTDSDRDTYEAYEKPNMASISKRKIGNKNDYEAIGLSSTSFFYDITSSSKISHSLLKNRNDSMQLYVNETDGVMRTNYYDNEYFTPVGLNVSRDTSPNDAVKVFRLTINGDSSSDNKIGLKIGKTYKVEIFLYDGEVKITPTTSLTVSDNAVSKIYVNDTADYHVYYDMLHHYYEDFSLESVNLMAVLTSGDIVDISNNPALFEGGKVIIATPEKNIAIGNNIVVLQYRYKNEVFETSFVLNVENREIKGINILEFPKKTEYKTGEALNLEGMIVELEYEKGDNIVLQTAEELGLLEVTGRIISPGKNTVALSYGKYSNAAFFEVTGVGGSEAETTQQQLQQNPTENNEKQGFPAVIIIVLSVVVIGGILAVILMKKKRNTAGN